MNQFEETEREGRAIYFSYVSGHCKEHYFTKDRYCEVDMFITGNTDITAVIEIKNRTAYTSTEIDKLGGQMLEYNKFTALTSYHTDKQLYSVIYPDEIRMWDVSSITDDRFVIENKYPATTVGYDKRKKEKKVAYLFSDECCCRIKRDKDYEKSCGIDCQGQDTGPDN